MPPTAPTDDEQRTEPEAEDRRPEPLLDLTTLEPERQLVVIKTKEDPDGKSYELRTMADFGIAEQQWLSQAGREYQRLWDKVKLTDREKRRLKHLLDEMTDKVLDAPKEVIKTLKDWQRAQVVLAFTVAPLASAMMETALPEELMDDDLSISGS